MDDQCCELREIHRLLAEMHRRLHTAATAESNLASTVTDLTAKVASLEAAAGVQPPAPPPPPA